MNKQQETSPSDRKKFIIGSNGRLAQAIINYYGDQGCFCLKREEYRNWGNINDLSSVKEFFIPKLSPGDTIFITSGILNSKEEPSLVNEVNFLLPSNIIEALQGLEVNIVTFGTILENLKSSENVYVQSKIRLSEKVKDFRSEFTRVTHFRLHTLYGYDLPSEFMFLGQIYSALKNNSVFNMTSGIQIREYHHLDDVVNSMEVLLSKNRIGVNEITSGNGIRLRDLALRIFAHFNSEHLLRMGELSIEQEEKYLNDYKRNVDLENIDFRDPFDGVIHYLKTIL